MILDSAEIEARVNSPFNLLNRLKTEVNRAVSIVSVPDGLVNRNEPAQIPSIPSIDELVENAEDKINKATAISGAKSVMAKSIKELERRLVEVEKPIDLAKVAVEMNKIVNGSEEKNKGLNTGPIIIWKPEVHNEAHYETVMVSE